MVFMCDIRHVHQRAIGNFYPHIRTFRTLSSRTIHAEYAVGWFQRIDELRLRHKAQRFQGFSCLIPVHTGQARHAHIHDFWAPRDRHPHLGTLRQACASGWFVAGNPALLHGI